MLKNLVSTLFIFIFILCIEILSVSLFTQSIPNQLVFTALDNISFYMNLLSANPAMAIELTLIKNPVFIVQRLDDLQTSQIWGIYFMPVNIITLFFLSLFISSMTRIKTTIIQWIWLIFASCILMFSIFYLRIQTCCTTTPTWVVDIWLFSQVSNPLANTALWQEIYIQISNYFTLIQFSLAFSSAAILFAVYISLFKDKSVKR